MYIKHHMTVDPVTISEDMLLPDARNLLNECHFQHLPVVDGEGLLVGMITDRDLRSAWPSSVLSKAERQMVYERVKQTAVVEIMSTEIVSLSVNSTLDDALLFFDRERVGAMPVVEDGRVVGIFSNRDLLAAYKRIFGVGEKGSILVVVEDDGQPDLLSKIALLLEEEGITLTRLLKVNDPDQGSNIFLRIHTFKLAKVCAMLEANGFRICRPGS
ncbi:MAG: CBS domain-containing protein [Desulfobulbaceae bacterium]|uniref:CBS domain-containing protein n=1 Tax=Candidatus Desulfatifera sulfidica TaxID=2841691 RepID=A0A8J6N958_9BACT|nr:CBS domain-containing protein [Candidatus Desulfatifera sulfidica]